MAFKTEEDKLAYEAKMQKFYASMPLAPIAPQTTYSQKTTVPNLTQSQMADSVASCKHRYNMDQIISLQILGGVIAVWCGAFATVPVGLGLLVVSVWLRRTV